jgi:DNA mismatch endonuclease (patch repair protein)
MRAVKSGNTQPEITVRRYLHKLGYRFRLHRRDLPGVPDIVLPRLKKVIFVHGCFWHGHSCKRGSRVPKTRREYWQEKIERNRVRDAEHLRKLQGLGWEAIEVWECELRENWDEVDPRLREFLSLPNSSTAEEF